MSLRWAMRPPAADRRLQARRFEAFRQDYNQQRPHQALGQIAPASFYQPSPRAMPNRLPEPQYRSDMTIRKVRTSGEIRLGGRFIHISSALAGDAIGLEEIEQGWRVWFYREPIGILDHRGQKLLPIQPG